jgi:predicted DNA-binding transcriptional regulator AlpA
MNRSTKAPSGASQKAPPRKECAAMLRPEGLYRWNDFADRIPFTRETWRQRVKAGTAPKPQPVGPNTTAWRGADLIAWLENPAGFKPSGPSKE